MTAEQKFEGDISRITGPTMAAAVVEFLKRSKGEWLIVNGKIHQVVEAEQNALIETTVGWSIWTEEE